MSIIIKVFIVLKNAAPSAPPQNISATVGTTSISLSWIKPGANDRNGEIRSYTVTFVRADTGAQRTRNSGSESATLFGLEPFTTYTIRVAAYTVAIGPFSSALRVTTLEDGVLLKCEVYNYVPHTS